MGKVDIHKITTNNSSPTVPRPVHLLPTPPHDLTNQTNLPASPTHLVHNQCHTSRNSNNLRSTSLSPPASAPPTTVSVNHPLNFRHNKRAVSSVPRNLSVCKPPPRHSSHKRLAPHHQCASVSRRVQSRCARNLPAGQIWRMLVSLLSSSSLCIATSRSSTNEPSLYSSTKSLWILIFTHCSLASSSLLTLLSLAL